MKRTLRLSRKTTVPLGKRLLHRTTSGRRVAEPNLYPQMVSALRRTIKLHRRLMKVAPMMFDYGLRNRLEKEIAEQEAWNRQVEAMLRKVYGETDPVKPPGPTSAFDFLVLKFRDPWSALSRAKRRKVDELYTEWELWMEVAKNLRERISQQLRPPLPGLGTISSMIEVAMTLGRLSTGLETADRKS